jgi:NADH-quinone oxidoreductase subunit E
MNDKLINLLQEAQSKNGYVSEYAIQAISDEYGIPKAKIYGVATFYSQFRLKPLGRNTIKVCRGTACHVARSLDLVYSIKEILGLKENEDTTKDLKFTMEEVACLGCCSLSPAVMINEDVYAHVTAEKIKKVLVNYK